MIIYVLLLTRDKYISGVSKLGAVPGFQSFKETMPIYKAIDDEALPSPALYTHGSHVAHKSPLLIKDRVLKQGPGSNKMHRGIAIDSSP